MAEITHVDLKEMLLKGDNTHEIIVDVDNGKLCYVDFVRKNADTISKQKHFLRSHISEINEGLNKFADDNIVLKTCMNHGFKNHLAFLINYHEDTNSFVVIQFGFFSPEDKEEYERWSKRV